MAATLALAGRAGELESVRRLIAASPRSEIMLIEGEAGIGKSRLVCTAAKISSPEVITLFGWCLQLSESLPLLPVIDIVRALASLDAGQLLKAALADCPRFVSAEVLRVLPELSDAEATADVPADITQDGGWQRERLFEAIRRVLWHAGQQQRLALVAEDMHWADATTLDFFDYVLAPNHPIGVPIVLTARTEGAAATEAGGRWRRLTKLPGSRRLELLPLSAPETAAQVELLLGNSVPARFVDAVYARSEGNPFFTEQLVSAGHDGVRTQALPSQVSELLLSRVEHLSPIAHDVLTGLALAGLPLDETSILAITGHPLAELRPALRELLSRRLVRPFDDDQGRFLPRHALLGDAIRGALLPSERGELHSRIADLLVRLDDGSVAAAIAEHLRGANRREEELLWRVRAGRKADALFAYSESCMHWRRALELVSDAVTAPAFIEGMSLADLYGTAGDAFTAAGEGEAASALSKEALTRIGRDADRRSRADVLRRAADWSEPQRALKLLDEALALYRQLPPSRGQVLTMREIAVISHHEGMPSKEIIRDTAELAESLGVRDVAVQMRAVLAAAPADEGEIDAAIAEMSDLCRELDDADDPLLHAWVAMCHTSLLFDAGRLVDVPAVGAVALDRAAEYGSERSLVTSIVRTNVCKALTELGDIDTAAALIDPVTDETPRLSNRLSHECRADLDMLRGNLDAAASRWAQLHELPVEPLEFALAAWDREAELRLWRSEPETAISGVLGVLNAANEATGQNFSGSPLLLHCGRLFVSALRGCADIADTARASRDAAKLACAQSAAENLATLLSGWTPDPFVTTFALRTAAAEGASWRAEWARLSGRPDAAAWARAAELWSAQSRPHRAAYGRWRQAQALLARPGDRPAATLALREAIRLGSRHRPLSAEIENLAKWAAIDLRPADDPRGRQRPQHTAAFGLTERELAVLRLLSEGKTNPQIAAALFMSPKTASVHVTHILRKLDVSSRVQAAATAERAGLLQTL